MIKLYHGSNIDIKEIDLSLCKNGKDFGKGFYLNPNFDQAAGMAQKAVRITKSGVETVNQYEFDESILSFSQDLKIKIFEDYTEEWAEFIVMNRKNRTDVSIHDYDIIIGPIADDTVGVQIRRFIQGYLPISQLIEELRFHGNHAVQYYFGTEKAIKLLKRI